MNPRLPAGIAPSVILVDSDSPLAPAELPAGPPELWPELFDLLPSGVMVVDRERRLLAANRAARELIGLGERGDFADRCCTIFGCGAQEGLLSDACLTELAAEAEGSLPEIRVDLPAGSPVGAIWVTASPLSSESNYTVFQIRRGERGDRRRRTDPHWLGERRLDIRVLGPTSVESAEGQIGGSWLQHRPGQLLKLLVAERGRSVTGDQLAAALWPAGGANALNTVRHYVHVLRQRLEPDRERWSESSFVLVQPSGYLLDPMRVSIDADLFERRIGQGSEAYLAGDELAAVAAFEEALELYGGDFLADDPYAEWALAERDRLRELAGVAARALTEYFLHSGRLEDAARCAERLLTFEPYDVDVQRAVLTVALLRGRRSEAARRYGTMRKRLQREFGDDLPFQLSELSEQPASSLHLL